MGYASNRKSSRPADSKPGGKSPVDIADKYLDAFSKLVSFTNAGAIALALIAVLSWLFIIEPDHADILRKKQAKIENQKREAIEHQKQEQLLFEYINDRNNSNQEILENAFVGKKKVTIREQDLDNSAQNFVRLYEFAFDSSPKQIVRLNKALRFKAIDSISHQKKDSLSRERTRLLDSMIGTIRDHDQEIGQKFQKKNDSIENYFAAQQKARSEKLGGVNSGVKAVLFFTADPTLGPVSIILFIGCLIGFVFFQRARGQRYLAKALRTYIEHKSWEKLEGMHDLNVQSPFWIVPIPRKIDRIEATEYAPIFGLRQYVTDYVVLLLICLIALVGIQCRLLQLQMRDDGSEMSYKLAFLSYALICGTVTISVIWLTSKNKTIALYNHEPAYDPGRRRAIATMLTLSIVGPIAYKARIFTGIFSKQRKLVAVRKKKKRELYVSPGVNGWYHNSRSDKYHYVDYRGYTPGLRYAQAKDIEILARDKWQKVADKAITPHLNSKIAFGRRSWVMEQYALTLVGNGFPAAAVDVLEQSAIRFPKNVRTLHLLKKIALVHGHTKMALRPLKPAQTISDAVNKIYKSNGHKTGLPPDPYLQTMQKVSPGTDSFVQKIIGITFNRRSV